MTDDDTDDDTDDTTTDPIATVAFHSPREATIALTAMSMMQAELMEMAPMDPQAAFDAACLFNVQHRAFESDPQRWIDVIGSEADSAIINGEEMSLEASIPAMLEEDRVDPADHVREFHPDAEQSEDFVDSVGVEIDID